MVAIAWWMGHVMKGHGYHSIMGRGKFIMITGTYVVIIIIVIKGHGCHSIVDKGTWLL